MRDAAPGAAGAASRPHRNGPVLTHLPLIGHQHPGPVWPALPGEPIGVPRPIFMQALAATIAAAAAGCAECTRTHGDNVLHDPAQIAALAATVYAAMPQPEPGVPRPVHQVRTAARRAVATPQRDFTPVMTAVVMLSRQGRSVVLADLVEIAVQTQRQAPPPPALDVR